MLRYILRQTVVDVPIGETGRIRYVVCDGEKALDALLARNEAVVMYEILGVERLPPPAMPAPVATPFLCITARGREFEASEVGDAGACIVGRGASVLEAMGEWALEKGYMQLATQLPGRCENYRVKPNSKVELEPRITDR